LQTCFLIEEGGILGCWLVIASRRFEGTFRLHLKFYESVSCPITLRIKVARFFEIIGRGGTTQETFLNNMFLIILSSSLIVFC